LQAFGGFLHFIFIECQKGGDEYMKEKRIFVGMMVIAFCIFALTPIVWSGPIEEAVQLTQDYLKAFHEGNAEALAATFAKDGAYIPWAGPFPIVGRDAFRAAMAGWFKAYPIRFLMLRDESRKAYGDTVIYYCNWTLIYGDGRNPTKTVYARTSSVSATVEGKRLILVQATSLLPVTVP
jgi:uncharacterized protein (TIGR02246 family)